MTRTPRWQLSAKARLALFCAVLFLLSGGVLLALNYVLVRAALPPATGETVTATPSVGPSAPASRPGGEVELGSEPDSKVISMDLEEYRADVLNTLLVQSGLTLAAASAVALVLGWVTAKRMLQPVHQIASAARRLSADSLDQRLRMRGPRDELTELADTFDAMLDRLATSFDSQRRFVANASHELRTPLAAQRTMIEVAMNRPGTQPTTMELCHRLLTMNQRSEALIEGLLTLAASDRGLDTTQPVRLDEVARHTAGAYESAAADAGVRLHVDVTPVTVPGDRVLLERLVSNLVDNAIKYNDGGDVWLSLDGNRTLTVSNTGVAVPEGSVDALFEPFRQLRRERTGMAGGVGLGLSIVASIARAHHGSVTACPRPEGGLDVTVRLPATAAV